MNEITPTGPVKVCDNLLLGQVLVKLAGVDLTLRQAQHIRQLGCTGGGGDIHSTVADYELVRPQVAELLMQVLNEWHLFAGDVKRIDVPTFQWDIREVTRDTAAMSEVPAVSEQRTPEGDSKLCGSGAVAQVVFALTTLDQLLRDAAVVTATLEACMPALQLHRGCSRLFEDSTAAQIELAGLVVLHAGHSCKQRSAKCAAQLAAAVSALAQAEADLRAVQLPRFRFDEEGNLLEEFDSPSSTPVSGAVESGASSPAGS